MSNSMNYYELLGVEKTASVEEIKAAYKKQMKKWHPDINKSENAENMSAKINEAKEVLLDEVKRKDYDEYLENKINENYNRYTQKKQYAKAEEENKKEEEYQNQSVTKWQYLKDWLNYANVSFTRKIIGLVFVLLESFLCLILKYFIIGLAFIIFFVSEIIRQLYYYLASIIGIFLIYVLFKYVNNGYSSNNSEFNLALIIILIFISSYILPCIGNKLLSANVFNFLYNKIDINLFKLAVGYKD